MNSKKLIRILLLVLIAICPVWGFAQTNADKLFNEGQQLQKVETVKSQNAAIKKYQQAKVLYSTEAKKEQCDNQVAICRNTIKRLRKESETKAEEPATASEPKSDAAQASKKREPAAQLSLSQTRLDFSYKPKDGYKPSVDVTCNYQDWSVASKPEWITVYTSESSISVEVAENDTDEDRSGIIKIVCDDASAELIVNQDKAKTASKIINKVFRRKKNK